MISVIIPYKDAAPWIGRCCESLTRQDGDFEFIMINDWSADNSRDIVEEYIKTDSRFVGYFPGGEGVSAARNMGLVVARGDWITFLDADDEMLPHAYRTMTNAAKSGANIIQFNHLRYYTAIDKLALKYTNEGGVFTLPDLPVHWFGVWNKLVRADIVEDVRFDESLQYGEDGLFVLECLAKEGRIYHADRNKTTVKHRFDNKSSLSRSKTLSDIVKQLRAYEEFLLRHDAPEIRVAVCLEMARLWDNLAGTVKSL